MSKEKPLFNEAEQELIDKKKRSLKQFEYKNMLEVLENKHGELTPHAVVEAAQSPTNPLHDWFEWDDTEAAHKFRLVQARLLIRTVRVKIQGKQVQQYLSVKVSHGEGDEGRAYMKVERVLSNEQLKRQLITSAVRDLKYWQQKYKDIQELAGIVDDEALINLEHEVFSELEELE